VTGTQIPPADSGGLIHRLDRSSFTSKHALIYAVLLVGHFFDGYLINVTGVVIPGASKAFHIGSGEACWFSTALFAGMLGGAAIAGIASDRLGRKYPLAVSIFIFAAFSLVVVFVGDYPMLLAARVCQGIGLGAEIAIVLPYIAEFALAAGEAMISTHARNFPGRNGSPDAEMYLASAATVAASAVAGTITESQEVAA
jgi:MFS transporter, putative metabolite:H+ symporter